MNSIFQDQAEFMVAGRHGLATGEDSQIILYGQLIMEELNEVGEAYEAGNLKNLIKEVIDLIYVSSGLLNTICTDPTEAWNLVHKNNMYKVSGDVQKNAEGKIQKSEESIKRKEEMMEAIAKLVVATNWTRTTNQLPLE